MPGIVTLGHAAFFGVGAYTVGMLGASRRLDRADQRPRDRGGCGGGLRRLVIGLVLLRTTGLTLLMLTLVHRAAAGGGRQSRARNGPAAMTVSTRVPIDPIFGRFEFNPLIPRAQYIYILCVLFIGFLIVRTIVYSPFGESLTGIRENTLRMHAVGAPVRKRLVICYAISAAIAGVAGAMWAQSNAYVNMSTLRPRSRGDGADHPGAGRLRPALRRVRRRRRLYGACRIISPKSIRPPGSSASA